MSNPPDRPHGPRTNVPSSSRPVPLNTVSSAGPPASLTPGLPGAIFPGALVAQFCLKRELGRGGMGVVYDAEDEVLRRRVALKLMNPQTAADEGFRERFLREGRAVAALKSDHVVSVYAAGDHGGTLYLAMEYIDGPTLDAWLKGRTVTVADVLWVARDLLRGLSAAHARGLIHRDVKPGNVMLEESTGRLKLLDFGLVRDISPKDATATVGALGTPSYMSPEQAREQKLDARTDLFSAGVVLYRLVAGKSPFARGSMSETLIALGTETPPPLTGVPAPLGAFVARLMARDPAGRPKDAAAALAELRDVEARLARGTAPTDPDFDTEPEPRPRRKLTYAALGALAVLLAVAAGVLLSRDKPKGEAVQGPPAAQPQPPALDPDPPKPVVAPKPPDAPRRFPSADVLRLIVADIDARPGPKAADDGPTRLYLYAPHLAPGASLFPSERDAYRAALAALSSHLKPGGELLRPLDKERTVFAVEPVGEFRAPDGLLSGYPYGLTFEAPESVANDDAFVRAYTGPVAFVRADWFVRYARNRLRPGKDAVFGTSAPVPRPVEEWARYWDTTPFTVFPAADELGVDKDVVKGAIRRHGPLAKTYQLGPLADGGTVPRARWESREFATSAFQELARELGLGLPVLTK